MFGSTNVYGIIFYQVYLLTWINILLYFSYFYLLWNSGDVYLAAGSSQHLYHGMHIYVVIVIMDIYWSKPSDKIINNNTCIISEESCIWFSSRKISLQIRHFNFRAIVGYINSFQQQVFW